MNHSIAHSMYYVALVCPRELDEKVLRFKQWMKEQFGSVVALKSPAHITLVPPFWLGEIRETELKQTLQSFTSDLEEQVIQLEAFSYFSKRVLFVHVKENPVLQELQSQTEIHFMQSFGDVLKKDEHPFHPHITIANRDVKPCDFEKAWQHFSRIGFNEEFRIKTISLLKLTLGRWNLIDERNW